MGVEHAEAHGLGDDDELACGYRCRARGERARACEGDERRDDGEPGEGALEVDLVIDGPVHGRAVRRGEVAVEDGLLRQGGDAEGGDEGENEVKGAPTRARGGECDESADECDEADQRQPDVGDGEGQRAEAGEHDLERGHEEQAVGERERGDEGKRETRAPGKGGGEGLAGLGELASGGVCGECEARSVWYMA